MEQVTQQQGEGARISKDQINALQILIQSAQLACKNGAFSLDEADVVAQAVKKFVIKKEPVATEATEATEATTSEPKVI